MRFFAKSAQNDTGNEIAAQTALAMTEYEIAAPLITTGETPVLLRGRNDR